VVAQRALGWFGSLQIRSTRSHLHVPRVPCTSKIPGLRNGLLGGLLVAYVGRCATSCGFWSAHAEPLVTRFTLAVLVVGSEFRNPCPCGAWRAGAAPEGFDCAVLRTSARAPMSVNVSHWRRFLRSHDPDQMRTLPHQGSLSGHAHTFPTTPRRCRGRGGSVLETGRKTQRCQTMKRACAVAPSWDCHRREPTLAQ